MSGSSKTLLGKFASDANSWARTAGTQAKLLKLTKVDLPAAMAGLGREVLDSEIPLVGREGFISRLADLRRRQTELESIRG
jgi:hypothetical protein